MIIWPRFAMAFARSKLFLRTEITDHGLPLTRKVSGMGEVEPSFTPGEVLNDELEARGWSTAKFAETLGRTVEATTAVLEDRTEITAEIADEIGQALGTGPELWLNLQDNYRSRYIDMDHRPVLA